MKQSEQGFNFQIKMGNEGQFLTCLSWYSLPAQFNWDQVIAPKATLNTLSSFSVTPAHLVILMLFVKNCHNEACLTEKNHLYVIAQSFCTKPKSDEKNIFLKQTSFLWIDYILVHPGNMTEYFNKINSLGKVNDHCSSFCVMVSMSLLPSFDIEECYITIVFCTILWIMQINSVNVVLRTVVLWILFLLQKSIFSVIFLFLK